MNQLRWRQRRSYRMRHGSSKVQREGAAGCIYIYICQVFCGGRVRSNARDLCWAYWAYRQACLPCAGSQHSAQFKHRVPGEKKSRYKRGTTNLIGNRIGYTMKYEIYIIQMIRESYLFKTVATRFFPSRASSSTIIYHGSIASLLHLFLPTTQSAAVVYLGRIRY